MALLEYSNHDALVYNHLETETKHVTSDWHHTAHHHDAYLWSQYPKYWDSCYSFVRVSVLCVWMWKPLCQYLCYRLHRMIRFTSCCGYSNHFFRRKKVTFLNRILEFWRLVVEADLRIEVTSERVRLKMGLNTALLHLMTLTLPWGCFTALALCCLCVYYKDCFHF